MIIDIHNEIKINHGKNFVMENMHQKSIKK